MTSKNVEQKLLLACLLFSLCGCSRLPSLPLASEAGPLLSTQEMPVAISHSKAGFSLQTSLQRVTEARRSDSEEVPLVLRFSTIHTGQVRVVLGVSDGAKVLSPVNGRAGPFKARAGDVGEIPVRLLWQGAAGARVSASIENTGSHGERSSGRASVWVDFDRPSSLAPKRRKHVELDARIPTQP